MIQKALQDFGQSLSSKRSISELIDFVLLELRTLLGKNPDDFLVYDKRFKTLELRVEKNPVLSRLFETEAVEHFLSSGSNPILLSAERLRLPHTAGIETLLLFPFFSQSKLLALFCFPYADKSELSEDKLVELAIYNQLTNAALAVLYLQYELQSSDERFRTILNVIPDLLFRLSHTGEYLDVYIPNDWISPVRPEDLIGKNMRDILSTESSEAVQRYIDQVLETKLPVSYFYQLDEPDGIHDYEGRLYMSGPAEVLFIARDVTQQLRIERAEREQRILAEALQETTSALNSSLELNRVFDTIFTKVNQVLPFDGATILLLEGDEVHVVRTVGHVEALQNSHFPIRDAPNLMKLRETGIPSITADTAQSTVFIPTPEIAWVKSAASVCIRAGDDVIGFLSVDSASANAFGEIPVQRLQAFADQAGIAIRNARLYQESLQAAQDLDSANRAKSRFLANMSHELRTPLNAILGFTQIMARDSSLNAKQQEHLRIINQSGENLLMLINDILEMSKIEAGQQVLHLEILRLHDLLSHIHEMFLTSANRKGLELKFLLEPDLPLLIKTDPNKLRQILSNLLSNAIKFTERGSILLQVGLTEGSQLKILVKDTGVGIAQEELSKVFEAFVQTASGLQSQRGTGLGLSISQQFAQLLKGSITVESRLNQGTSFVLQLPVELVSEGEHTPIAMTVHRKVNRLADASTKYRILVADDDANNRLLLQEWLSQVGFEIQTAEDGQQALELWRSWDPHLICMDMRMPVMDGYTATRLIKQDLSRKTIIIAVTASVFEHQVSDILEAGCDAFIRKPVEESELFQILAEQLGLSYIYDERRSQEETETTASDLGQLDQLPANLLQDFYQAVRNYDQLTAQTIIKQQIEPNFPLMAKQLYSWVSQFRFESLEQRLGAILNVD